MKRRVPTRLEKSNGLRAGEEMDRSTWCRKIIIPATPYEGESNGEEEDEEFIVRTLRY